jgi:hypothetical protein
MLVIIELFLIGNKMLIFVDYKLDNINETPKEFMGGLDVIMTNGFCQVSPIQDSWTFKSRINGLNILGTYFWQENIKCYELK